MWLNLIWMSMNIQDCFSGCGSDCGVDAESGYHQRSTSLICDPAWSFPRWRYLVYEINGNVLGGSICSTITKTPYFHTKTTISTPKTPSVHQKHPSLDSKKPYPKLKLSQILPIFPANHRDYINKTPGASKKR